ncbi:MAG: PD-(D/E)XK nuclease family protein [Bellilinea sp.]
MSKPLAWSYSALNKFSTCPHQYYETRILDNFKDEPGEAALWGTYVHKCIEDAINAAKNLPSKISRDWLLTAMPENTKDYVPQVLEAIGEDLFGVNAEVKLAINNRFEPVAWGEGRWTGSISDVLRVGGDTAEVIDWKLGKIKPTPQLKLNALMVFYNYPEVQTVLTSFEWLQFNRRTVDKHTRDQIPELWKSFENDLRQYVQAFKTDTWQKRPSGLCGGWCPVTTCSNWRPKR